jgi:CRP/FNR family cyclic AMP-dependent transcriptional regulator
LTFDTGGEIIPVEWIAVFASGLNVLLALLAHYSSWIFGSLRLSTRNSGEGSQLWHSLRRPRNSSNSIPRDSFRPSTVVGRSKLLPKSKRSLRRVTRLMLFSIYKEGKVKLAVVSEIGKEATIGILNSGDFFGEGCLAGQPLRLCSATAMTDCSVMKIDKKSMNDVLHREHAFSDMFVAYLLARNIRYEEDLVDQLFNSSEKRLARILLLLAHFGKEGTQETLIPKMSQETLAEMIGTTRSRVSFFMNRFRKLGFIDYHAGDELQVHSSLLNVVLHD